jgi:hypothetical protein
MYSAPDDYGTSYYFRGAISNNWVSFAGFYWRIIRVNGDGSVRMIYTGSTAPTESQAVVMTGAGTYIGNSKFNPSENWYMNGSTNSTIKTYIDNWYSTNLTSYVNKISDSVYCNDTYPSTDPNTPNGIYSSIKTIYYGGYIRLFTYSTPILKCYRISDAYTVSDTTNGNGKLTYPIALITADEISISGGVFKEENIYKPVNDFSHNYLYNNEYYYSLTPSYYSEPEEVTNIFSVTPPYLETNTHSLAPIGVRPVISLKSTVTATGTGAWNDPYVVQ